MNFTSTIGLNEFIMKVESIPSGWFSNKFLEFGLGLHGAPRCSLQLGFGIMLKTFLSMS